MQRRARHQCNRYSNLFVVYMFWHSGCPDVTALPLNTHEKPRENQVQNEQQHVFENEVRAAGDQRPDNSFTHLSLATALESRIRLLLLVAQIISHEHRSGADRRNDGRHSYSHNRGLHGGHRCRGVWKPECGNARNAEP